MQKAVVVKTLSLIVEAPSSWAGRGLATFKNGPNARQHGTQHFHRTQYRRAFGGVRLHDLEFFRGKRARFFQDAVAAVPGPAQRQGLRYFFSIL